MFNMNNSVFNILLVISFIVFMISLSLFLQRYNHGVQLIVIFSLIIIGFIADKVLLFYFRDYLKQQWYYFYYKSNGSFGRQREIESIIADFGFIGIGIYTVIGSIAFRCSSHKSE
jgi:hypothetical protein